jgi:hypothetical protein
MTLGRESPDQPQAPSVLDVASTQAFLDQARVLADWHRQRADGFESKASTLIGFSGVILTLLTLTSSPISHVRGSWQTLLVILAVLGAVAFLVAAVAAVVVMNPRQYRYAARSQLRREWENYRDHPSLTTAQILGMLADQLICAGDKSPIDTLADDALDRGKWVRVSVVSLLVGLGLLAAVAAILVIEVALR